MKKKKDATYGDGVPIMWLFWETFQYSRRAFDEAVRPSGVTATQLSVLNRLAERPGLSGAELARITHTTPQAANLALVALERKALIERKLDTGSGHIVRSVLTEKGRRIVNDCYAEVHEVDRRLLAVLDDNQKRTLSDLLTAYLSQFPRPD